jgi:acyl-CoA thioesterase-1
MNRYVKGGHRNIEVMKLWLVAALAVSCAACAPRGEDRGSGAGDPAPRVAAVATKAAAPAAARPRVAVLGDSLTAGLGVAKAASYPSLLQERLDAAGLDFEVVNAGVSGDTSAGGLARLDWALDGDVRVLIVALGGNDGLRGLPAEELQGNLAQIIERAQTRGITVILAGMEAPPNYGAEYASAFRQAYRDLAREHRLPFLPFLLDKVAGQPALNQGDGIHPNPAGAAIVAGTVWTVLEPLLDRIAAS